MSMLIPILLPGIVNATANIALGVTNALQGTSSNVSLQIGNKVFTTAKGFPFERLPPELRREIIEIAYELSKDLVLPPLDFIPNNNPFQPYRLQPSITSDYSNPHSLASSARNNPLDPSNPHYRSIVGESKSANGYPQSAWRWTELNSEWREWGRRLLWRRCEISGTWQYNLMLSLMKNPYFDIFVHVREIELHQGFKDHSVIYQILRHPLLTKVESISILPTYPFYFGLATPLFDFGLQLIPLPQPGSPPLKHLNIGLPLEAATNATGRQHLVRLKAEKLSFTVLRPSVAFMGEMAGLIRGSWEVRNEVVKKITEGEEKSSEQKAEEEEALPPIIGTKTVSIRLLHPNPNRELTDPSFLFHEGFDDLQHVNFELHLPARTGYDFYHPYIGRTNVNQSFVDKVKELVTSDERREKRYKIYLEDVNMGFGHLAALGQMGQKTKPRPETLYYEAKKPESAEEEKARLREVLKKEQEEEEERKEEAKELERVRNGGGLRGLSEKEREKEAGKGKAVDRRESQTWERETNLRLLGGLINLRLESKKH